MKKLHLTLLCCLYFVLSMGQQGPPAYVSFEAGPSLNFMTGNEVLEEHAPLIGFHGGLTYEVMLKEKLSIKFGLSYERKGSKTTTPLTDLDGNFVEEADIDNRFEYFTVPLLIKYTAQRSPNIFVNAGPYFGVLNSHHFIIKSNSFDQTEDGSQFFKTFDIGVSTGVGLCLDLNEKLKGMVELRNDLGLYNISSIEIINNGTVNTHALKLIFGISYFLQPKQESN